MPQSGDRRLAVRDQIRNLAGPGKRPHSSLSPGIRFAIVSGVESVLSLRTVGTVCLSTPSLASFKFDEHVFRAVHPRVGMAPIDGSSSPALPRIHLRGVSDATFGSILALFFAVCVPVAAQPNEQPVPTELLPSSVFIQKGMVFGQKHDPTGEATNVEPCRDELNKWGRFKVVSDPKDADLIFRISNRDETQRTFVGSARVPDLSPPDRCTQCWTSCSPIPER
jgi:hypothetical protein